METKKQNTEPLFSVCIPLYNTEDYIKPCIESVLDQDWKDYEIVIVDDGSTDKSGQIADDYALKDNRINVIHQNNMGLFHTRIEAFHHANGRYIVSLDSDDYLEINALSTIANAIQQKNADLVIYNNYILRNGFRTKNIDIFSTSNEWSNNKEELWEIFFTSHRITSIWRKAISRKLLELEKLSAYPKIVMGEDWIHSYYPLLNSKKTVYINECLINYRILATSLTAKYDYELWRTLGIIYTLKRAAVLQGETETYNQDQLRLEYIQGVMKALVYIPGRVENRKRYYHMLDEIKQSELLQESLSYIPKKTIKMIYRFPLWLLSRKQYYLLYLIKKMCTILKIRN